MNRDFAEMLDALSAAGADFLIVGAHALAAHGRPRVKAVICVRESNRTWHDPVEKIVDGH